MQAIRQPNGRVLLQLNGVMVVAELGPNDASLFAAWLLGEDYPPPRV